MKVNIHKCEMKRWILMMVVLKFQYPLLTEEKDNN